MGEGSLTAAPLHLLVNYRSPTEFVKEEALRQFRSWGFNWGSQANGKQVMVAQDAESEGKGT